MNEEYRIVEQFGGFRIEEKRESEVFLDAISMLILYITGKETPRYTYWVSDCKKHFASLKEAKDYIPKLIAKYPEL